MGLNASVCCSYDKAMTSIVSNLNNKATSVTNSINTQVTSINSSAYSETSAIDSAITDLKTSVIDMVPDYSTPVQATSALQTIYDSDFATFKSNIISDSSYRYPDQLDLLGVNIPRPNIPAKDYPNFQYSGFDTGIKAIDSFPPNYINSVKDCFLANFMSDFLALIGFLPEFVLSFNLDWLARFSDFSDIIPTAEFYLSRMANLSCSQDHTNDYNTVRDTLDLTTDNRLDTDTIINSTSISVLNKTNLINATDTSKKIMDYAESKLIAI